MAKPVPDAGLDPVILARFLVMPGVMPLLDAFGRIPPGPMRDSVIHLALTLADQYSSAPPQYAMPDPLLTAVGFATPAPLEKPAGAPSKSAHGPLPESAGPEADVIARRKRGQHPQRIFADTGIPVHTSSKIIAAAKAAGMTFPTLRGKKLTGRPMEKKNWHTTTDTMSGQGLALVAKAAAQRGITPQQYIDRRVKAVEMAQAGANYAEISKATGATMKEISLFLSNARGAGINVPYSAYTMEAKSKLLAPEPEPSNVVQVTRFFSWPHPNSRSATHIANAARRRNLTPEAYTDLKESIVRQRMDGLTPTQIALNSGESPIFVKDTLQEATEKGAIFPKLSKWGLAS